jgi:hypothetical protein
MEVFVVEESPAKRGGLPGPRAHSDAMRGTVLGSPPQASQSTSHISKEAASSDHIKPDAGTA